MAKDFTRPAPQTSPAEAAPPVVEAKAESGLKELKKAAAVGPVVTLKAGGWRQVDDGHWAAPPSLSYRDDDGLMTAAAKDAVYTTDEALALEGKRHRQPPGP